MTARDYPADGLVIHWDAEVCIHSGVCARGLPAVFRPQHKPWVDPAGAEAERIAATVEQCPSGALTYTRTAPATAATDPPASPPAAPAPGVTVTVSENGPYEITGGVRVVAADGTVLKDGERLFLCRCGHSASKPYCDGSHRREGFSDDGLGKRPSRG